MKDMWIDEFERLYNEAAENGPVTDKVYWGLTVKTDSALRERMADEIDHARMLKKEGHEPPDWDDAIPVNIYGETDEDA